MRLPKFEYVEPKSLDEASAILAADSAARLLAGGTDLLVNMKHRVDQPAKLVNLKRLPGLDYVRMENGETRIGALTSLKKLSANAQVAGRLPALAQAAARVGAYHHQTMGTVGGNLCQQTRCKHYNQSRWWRSAKPPCLKTGGEVCHVVDNRETCYSTYCGDLAPALLVLGAEVVLHGAAGVRRVPLGDIFSGQGLAPFRLARGEILAEVIVPGRSHGEDSRYLKFARRGGLDFPIVGAAFW
ncbi:MAG: FAD binding domain-containing protein, partial [Thermodesulfobacteriota bacterium]